MAGELVVDCFAGGGGASTGIEHALNRPVDIAINHSAKAIAMHRANHPETRHFQENIHEVDPVAVCAGRPVGLAWFSPDCTHHSRAKGTVPLDNKLRGLAWVVVDWARKVRPRLILLENVEEFQSWGPLLEETCRPDPERVGETFREWCAALTDLGYHLEFRSLVAADYGTPTTRKRLFLVAHRESRAPAWPDPTHGKGRAASWCPAAQVIDWGLPCPSIFERKRPLAEATMKRIAAGIRRFVVEAQDPFVIPLTHQGDLRNNSVQEPLRTVTAAHRGELALVEPFIVRHGHYSTISGAGLREGCGAGTFRGQMLETPLATVCATNDKHLVCPVITKHYGRQVGHRVEKTLGTVTARDHHALTAAFLSKFYGTSTGSDLREPSPTITAGGGKGGGHVAEVRAFLLKFHGGERGHSRGQSLESPLRTIDTSNRFGLVTIHGETYEIVDIGMRMLQPHELFAAQGFPADYEIRVDADGRSFTKTEQISLAGNSVCPQVAAALVMANSHSGRRAAV